MIDRDLKPGNVLLGGLRPGPRISDFGLAHAAGREAHREGGGAGTPAYMAPEQFDASTREHGPWTDLYALGCLAWTLVTRAPPFGRLPVARMRTAHRSLPVPALEAPMTVADGFEDWVKTLLEKDPARRFRRAADAAYALRSLRSPPLSRPVLPVGEPVPPETTFGPEPTGESTFSWTASDVGADAAIAPPAPSDLGYVLLPTPPPQPADWRRPGLATPPIQLLGAGLGLYGMRTVPFVGREAERDLLWSLLRETRETGTAHAVLLTGPTGVGKSRLARWLAERAHEVGAADSMVALHAPDHTRENGLGGMLFRFLGLGGLKPAAAAARARAVLHRSGIHEPDEIAALHHLADPAGDPHSGRGPVRFGHPREPHVLVRRLIERLASDRPLILLIEDVQWGADAIALTEHLLEAQAESPRRC